MAWSAAMVVLDVAIGVLTSPITLVIIGIAALAAGIIYAYKHSETFRSIIDTMWATIKAVAGWLVGAGVAAFNAVADAIAGAWRIVQSVTTAVWGGIKTYLHNAWKDIHDAAVVAWDKISGVVTDAWNTVKRVATAAWTFIHDKILAPAWGAIKVAADIAWAAIRFAILQPIRQARDGLVVLWGFIHDKVLTPAWNGIKAAADVVWAAIRFAILQPIREARDGLVVLWTFIKDKVLSPVWDSIKGIATTAWNAIKGVILAPIRAVRDALGGKDGLWQKIEDIAVKAFGSLKSAIKTAADPILNIILAPFKAAAKKVGEFAKLILTVIEKIPGVGNDKIDKAKGSISKLIDGFATGGVVGRGGPNGTGRQKGGMVPGSGYGDKVPLHLNGRLAAMVEPGELVSVANRKATAALMGVNSAIPRFAGGGILNTQEMSDLWRSKGGNESIADTMGVIGLVESGGNPHARNPSGATGLWQILGQLIPGNLENPGVNALNAIAKYKAQGLHAWDASRSKWEKLIGKVVGPDLDPLKLIGDLPGIGDLPDWLKGTGKYVLSHVGDWIKSNVAKLIPGGGGGAKGPKGVGTFNGIPMADWVIDSLNYGRKHGAYGNPTSGYRPGFDSHTATGASEHQGTQYPHGAVDFGGYHDARALAEKLSYVHATAGFKYPLLAPKGFVDDGHASGTGHQLGGIIGPRLPFLGSYHSGGVAPTEGYARVAAGERMTPAGSGPLVNIENVNVGSRTDVNSFAERLAFRVATA
jgi:hypothetical protein